MKRKVVLYNPRAVFYTMPLPLLAVAAALPPSEVEVVVVDGRLDPPERLWEQLEGALCLGVTVLTGAPLKDALAVSRQARARFPKLPIVWGGWHPSLFPEMCAAEPSVTCAVVGQGERTLRELVERFALGGSPEGVPGCVWRDERGQIHTEVERPMAELEQLPPLRYDLVDVERYYRLKGRRQMDYISSQGCRFRCNFCADPAVYGRGWSAYSAGRMVGELAELHRRHPFDDLHLQDETYFTQKQRVADVAEGLLREGLHFSWVATMRADQGRRMDDALFGLCRRAGLRKVIIGLEAGSQEMIDHIQKDIRVEDMWECAERLLRHDIGAVINVIVGFPGESASSVQATLEMARRLRAMSPRFELGIFYFKPYPGNPIAQRLSATGWVFPSSLEGWADFDFVGEGKAHGNPWLSPAQKAEIDAFRFYQRLAYAAPANPLRAALGRLSRWRVERRRYEWPIERKIFQRLRPEVVLA